MASDVTESAAFYKLWAWVETHRKGIQWGAITLVVAATVTGYLLWQRSERKAAANDALSSAMTRSFMMGQASGPESFLKVASDFSGTAAAERALLVAGARYFIGGKYPEAQAQFEKYLREYRSGDFTDQARLGVAACFDAQGKSTEAIAAYKQIAAQRETDSAAAQAKLALARLYLAQGNFSQAHDYYLQLARPEFGPIGNEAESHRQQLLIEHPELSPAPLPPPGGPVPAPNPIKAD